MRRIPLPAGRAGRWLAALAAAGALGTGMAAARQSGPRLESLWYLTEDGGGFESFVRNVHRVTIVAPMAYEVDSTGTLRGRVDARVMRAARQGGVRVMPVVRQPGFSQTQLARLLRDPAARAHAAASLAGTCRARGYWGFQVDFENIRVQDGPLLTGFYRQIVGALHAAGCRAGIAVVPRVSDAPGESAYQYWMYGHWRGAYDYGALAAAGDFIVLMAYDQHSRHTPPGPVAGMPWVEKTLDFALSQGAPPEKILLGVPAYSRHWRAAYTGVPGGGGDAAAEGLGYGAARARVKAHGADLAWDARQKVYHATYDRETAFEYLYLENARTFGHKLALARGQRLLGFAAWRLGQEDPEVWERVGRIPLRRR